MQVTYQGEGYSVSEDCKKSGEAFAFLAMCQEVFTHRICLMGSKNGKACGAHAKFVHRVSGDGHHFHEMKCTKCGAIFSFGKQTDTRGGQLFPHWKDQQGNLYEDYGWHMSEWQAKQQQQAPASQEAF